MMMGTNSFLKNFMAFLMGGMLFSCSSMNSLTVPVTQPAPVFLPSTVRSVGIINRSQPSEQNKKLDQIDKILSVEGLSLDKEAALRAMVGLKDELSVSGMFDEVRILDDTTVNSIGMGVFPSALSWQQITKLCVNNQVDVIFALSFYDTDTRVDYDVVPVEIKGPLGVNIPAVEHRANSNTQVRTGWRIYDPVSQYVVDEFVITKFVDMQGVGINPVNAVKAIIVGRKENIYQVSSQIGRNYAHRLFPSYTRVRREYYVKGSDNFEVAKRRAQTGDWDGAAELWNREINNKKAKIAGRAHYNMAISNEINGNFNEAVDWATKSYTDYNIKEALDYIRILKRRIENEDELAFRNTH
jgi:hypothetical protein